MDKKLFKKLREREEKLIDAIYAIQELLDDADNAELSSMGDTFVETMLDFINDNEYITIDAIKQYIEEEMS